MLRSILLVALGGAAGSVARYLLSRLIGENIATAFPLATLTVNVAGCFVIGLISGMASGGSMTNGGLRLFLTVGFCGGFTTFSTFGNESLALMRSGELVLSAIYMAASVALGLAAVYAGMVVARHI